LEDVIIIRWNHLRVADLSTPYVWIMDVKFHTWSADVRCRPQVVLAENIKIWQRSLWQCLF